MMTTKKNKFVFVMSFLVILLFLIGYINAKNGSLYTNETDEKSIELTEQCIDFYNNNKKMPQLIAGKQTNIYYDSKYIMVRYFDKNKNNTIAISNYKNPSEKLNDKNDIWKFIEMNNENENIKRFIYIYKSNDKINKIIVEK